jgi:hypothetical protein
LEEEDILKECEQEEYEDDFADEEDAYQIIEKEMKKDIHKAVLPQ